MATPLTNLMFSQQDRVFQMSCEEGNVKATPRQASKFRMGRGTAIRFKADAIRKIEKPETLS